MAKIPLFIKGDSSKTCDGCTKCCDGYLSAEIHGKRMGDGVPCQFVETGVGCTIYKDRPKEPCKSFECFWRASKIMPVEFKPSEVGVIVTNQEIEGIPYLYLCEAGNTVPAEVLSWFLVWVITNQLNAEWQIGDKLHSIGSLEFRQALNRRVPIDNKEK